MMTAFVSEQAHAETANASIRIQSKKDHDGRIGRYLDLGRLVNSTASRRGPAGERRHS